MIEAIINPELSKKEIIIDGSLPKGEIKNSNLKLGDNEVLRNVNGEYIHKNYLDYLGKCWNSHYGIIVSPDIIWHIIMYETAVQIKKKPNTYRELFTDSDEKKVITIVSSEVMIPLDELYERLGKLVPTDTDLFVPSFSTTGEMERMAFISTFADAMQVYYDYMMLLCGIQKIKILGTQEDWDKIISNLKKLKSILGGAGLGVYYDRIIPIVEKIASLHVNVEFWNNIFSLEKCGSGSQVVMNGWIKDFFIDRPEVEYIHNFSALVSTVPYKNLSTKKSYELHYGLFSSNVEEDYLVPQFGYVLNDVTK